MLATGGNAIVAHKIGAKDSKKANEYFSLLILFGVASGIIISLLGTIFYKTFDFGHWVPAKYCFLTAETTFLSFCYLHQPIYFKYYFKILSSLPANRLSDLYYLLLLDFSNIILDYILWVFFKWEFL